jgi:hypothetical protein
LPDLAAGPEREEFESLWTDALQTAVHEVVWAHPPGLRAIVKEVVEAPIRERLDAGEKVDPAEVAAIADGAVANLRRNLYT